MRAEGVVEAEEAMPRHSPNVRVSAAPEEAEAQVAALGRRVRAGMAAEGVSPSIFMGEVRASNAVYCSRREEAREEHPDSMDSAGSVGTAAKADKGGTKTLAPVAMVGAEVVEETAAAEVAAAEVPRSRLRAAEQQPRNSPKFFLAQNGEEYWPFLQPL